MSARDERLWLLVTRRCNLRCGFCPLEFTGQDMPLDVARRSIAAYRRHLLKGTAATVKLFGGEPLLNWSVLQALIEEARRERSGLSFEITTNGMFLDADKIAYLRSRPEVEISLSLAVDGGAYLPEVCFNFILTQNQSAESAIARMRLLLSQGYRRFNFLPAFFTLWSEEELRELARTFSALARLYRGMRDRGAGFQLKNIAISSPFPLYNASLTVDVDGTVYSSSLAESRGIESFRKFLRVGSIDEWPERGSPRLDDRVLSRLIRRWAGPRLWDSTQKVDAALTRFVEDVSAVASCA